MRKSDIRKRMQEGFLELSPDIFETVMKETEKEQPVLQEIEKEKSKPHLEIEEPHSSKKGCIIRKEHLFSNNYMKYAISACASLAIFCICLFGIFGKSQNDIYLILDINPSIQIIMNDSFQVKNLRGLNQDGKDVIKKLKWNKKEPLLDILDSVIEDAAKDSYLKENSGILVTICLPDSEIYKELEDKMGKSIDRKLKEIGISGVTTAFQQGEKDSAEEGRSRLENKLVELYGVDAGQIQEMSVIELIRCGQEHGASGVTLSPESDRQWEKVSREKKEQEEKEKKKEENSSSDKKKPEKMKEKEVKPKPSKSQTDKKKSEGGKNERKSVEKEEQSSNSRIPSQPQKNVVPAAPAEEPVWTNPVPAPVPNESQPETNVDNIPEDENENSNNGQGDEGKDKNKKKKDKNGKNNKDKDKNNGKDNKDKDSSGKDNKDKDKDSGKNDKDKDKDSGKDNKDKDKDSGKNDKDKDSGQGNNKNSSSDKDSISENGSDKGSNNSNQSNKKGIGKSSPNTDETFLENI